MFNAFAAYPMRVVRLNFTENRKPCLTNQGTTLVGFLAVKTAELAVKDGDFDVDKSSSL